VSDLLDLVPKASGSHRMEANHDFWRHNEAYILWVSKSYLKGISRVHRPYHP
jgi:hypothetical protein